MISDSEFDIHVVTAVSRNNSLDPHAHSFMAFHRVEANDGNNTGNGKFAHLTPRSRT